jgi:CRISPR/Cas system endoribonuclease Cas6 (RAMP superfamily)
MLTNQKPITFENFKFAIESYRKINEIEKSSENAGITVSPMQLKISFPENSKTTPQYEFHKKYGKSSWVLLEYGRPVAMFDKIFLDRFINKI